MKTLKILNKADVSRAVGYTRQRIDALLAADIADGTPGRRFPRPLRDVAGRLPCQGQRVEWSLAHVEDWLKARMQ